MCWDSSDVFSSCRKGNWMKWRGNKFNVINVIDIYCYKGLARITFKHRVDAGYDNLIGRNYLSLRTISTSFIMTYHKGEKKSHYEFAGLWDNLEIVPLNFHVFFFRPPAWNQNSLECTWKIRIWVNTECDPFLPQRKSLWPPLIGSQGTNESA